MAEQIEGVKVRFGGRDWLVPAINFKRLRQIMPKILGLQNLKGEINESMLDDAVEIFHLALGQNYPDLKREELENMLDLRVLRQVMPMIMGQAGMVEVGEARPATPPAT